MAPGGEAQTSRFEADMDAGMARMMYRPARLAGECAVKIFTGIEDGQPAQTSLKTFEADFVEQPALVGDREAPFGVVVAAVVGVASDH